MPKIIDFQVQTEELEKAIKDIRNINWNDVKRLGARKATERLKKDIVDTIQRGNSPVKGERRYVDYSDSYKAQIDERFSETHLKKLRPVNLTLSGQMLRSIKGRVTDRGISIWFASPIAKYHNELGAGKSKVIRRMLPKDGEKFKTSVTLRASTIIGKAFEYVVKNKFK
jgi:hypothetical protein